MTKRHDKALSDYHEEWQVRFDTYSDPNGAWFYPLLGGRALTHSSVQTLGLPSGANSFRCKLILHVHGAKYNVFLFPAWWRTRDW